MPRVFTGWLAVATLVVFLLGVHFAAAPAWGEAPEGYRDYTNHKLVTVQVTSREDLRAIHAFDVRLLSEFEGLGPVDYVLPPEAVAALDARGVRYEVRHENVQELIVAERERIARAAPVGPRDPAWFEEYKTNDQINAFTDALVATYPQLVSKYQIGTSYEGRPIYALTVTGTEGGTDKAALCFNGMQHSREWISPMTVLYITDRLLAEYGSDPGVTAIMDKLTFYIVPVVNPDGYIYSWEYDRQWRKNRRDNGDGTYGVDPNRNWSVGWGGAGSSSWTGDDLYHGTAPFSESETQALRDYILDHPKILAHIDFHSYSQLILRPYGYDYIEPPDPDGAAMKVLGDGMADAIYSVHGEVYVSQPSYALYLAGGTCADWAYEEGGTFSWTIELRPDSYFPGFELPPEEIIPTGEENYAAITLLAESFSLPMKISFPEGLPGYVVAGQETTLTVDIQDVLETYVPDSGKLYYRFCSGAAFSEAPLTSLGGGQYEAVIPAGPCGSEVEYYFQVEGDGGSVVLSPPAAPAELYAADVTGLEIVLSDEFETDLGWTVGAADDDADTGIWDRDDPQGTEAQPEDDHTPAPGTRCWVTDSRAGSSLGTWDIDGGKTTLFSPALDLSGGDATISYWRWYSNDTGSTPHTDVFVVDISNNGGTTWTNVETVGPSGQEASGGWYYHEFKVGDVVTPTGDVQLRFVASDEGDGSLVEAALDDFMVARFGCDGLTGDSDGDGDLDLDDFSLFPECMGGPAGEIPPACTMPPWVFDFDEDDDIDLDDFAAFQEAFAGI